MSRRCWRVRSWGGPDWKTELITNASSEAGPPSCPVARASCPVDHPCRGPLLLRRCWRVERWRFDPIGAGGPDRGHGEARVRGRGVARVGPCVGEPRPPQRAGGGGHHLHGP
eukprot:1194564-Prorocentrum_minimum.AAC.8